MSNKTGRRSSFDSNSSKAALSIFASPADTDSGNPADVRLRCNSFAQHLAQILVRDVFHDFSEPESVLVKKRAKCVSVEHGFHNRAYIGELLQDRRRPFRDDRYCMEETPLPRDTPVLLNCS